MSYEMDVTFEGEFLRVRVTAQDSYGTSLAFFTELAAACEKHDCKKILVISDSTPLKTMEAFDHAEILRKTGFTVSHWLAWVELNPETREMDKFIENVLMNRSVVQVKIFADEPEARQWLLKNNAAL